MISVFPSTEVAFTDNGLKILKPLKTLIRKEDSGNYYIDLQDTLNDSSGNENLNYYISGNILRVTTPWGEQRFRIKNVSIENKRIYARGWHIFYDAENYIIEDSYVFEKNCNYALDHLNSATDVASPFTTISDVTGEFSYRCVRKSLAQAINDVLERWGGHLERDNMQIAIRQNIGQDRQIVISYGKNIQNIKAEENWNDVVTKLMPVGKDGLKLPEVWLSLDESLYEIPYTKVIHFEQNELNQEDFIDENGNSDETAYNSALENDLRAKGNAYLNQNSAPKVNYTLNAYIEGIVDIGDVIWVKHPKCKIDLLTNVIALEFDVISQKVKKVEFGNFKRGLKDLVGNITAKIEETVEKSAGDTTAKFQKELVEATNSIKSVLGNSYVINGGDKILVLDKLPKEEAQNVMMINSGGIGFSNTGINGTFTSAWLIGGTLDMQNINVINLVADMIKGGTLKLGSNLNESGIIELYDEGNTLIIQLDDNGITIFCSDGRTIKLNADIGFCGYDTDGTSMYWSNGDEFHMKKCVIDNQLEIGGKLRFMPLSSGTANDGVAVVAIT
ncbi:MAG: phage tail protein [Oscillospiraceae bacterium]|jgi:phage minor structural protein|nr:phage tail protein [Oscillospiraceae bacterium]